MATERSASSPSGSGPRRPTARQHVRRRPTAQQYRRRRVTALLAVALVSLGGVGIVRALGGGDPAAAPPSSDPTSVGTTGAPGTSTADPAAGAGPVGSAAADAPVPAPTTAGVPSPDHPVKLYIAGDSDAGTFGPYLQRLLKPTKLVDITLDYTSSTGLARPDFYDWPAHLAAKVPQVDPSIVVVTFGGNDSQGLTDSSGKFIFSEPKGDPVADAGWRAEYGKRVAKVMDLLAADGRTLIWVGIPNDNDPGVTAKLQVQDEVVREQVKAHPGVQFVDTWNRFSGRNGGWAEFVVDPRDGEGKAVRRSDGFHLNETGAEILALDIAEVVKTDLRARGASI